MGTGTAISTGDVITAAKMNAKLETVSTGDIVSGSEISTATLYSPTIYSGITISSGTIVDGRTTSTATANLSLTVTHIGKEMRCTTDGVIFTLPRGNASTALVGATYTIKNTGSAGAALIVVKSADTTAEQFFGCGNASGAGIYLLANTKATACKGDYVTVRSTGSTSWYIVEQVGTWASAT